ncbi:hypothetical protein [Erwinia psidii]|uniref:hypothetical protein n=1 Tax=Erwinia psidii TaxID=69224 RepID=UPI000F5386E4|nr:hypothetical protein [Erwinia psidii]
MSKVILKDTQITAPVFSVLCGCHYRLYQSALHRIMPEIFVVYEHLCSSPVVMLPVVSPVPGGALMNVVPDRLSFLPAGEDCPIPVGNVPSSSNAKPYYYLWRGGISETK